MTIVALLITSGLIWFNLVGLGLLFNLAIKDYAVSRISAPFAFCLFCFFVEHFYGLGGRLMFFPISTALSGWLFWRHRSLLRRNIELEAAFGIGFLYCLVWRFAFPDIDLSGEKIRTSSSSPITSRGTGFLPSTVGCRHSPLISTTASSTTRRLCWAAGSIWELTSAIIMPIASSWG